MTTGAGHHGEYVNRLDRILHSVTEASQNVGNVLDLFFRLFLISECSPLRSEGRKFAKTALWPEGKPQT